MWGSLCVRATPTPRVHGELGVPHICLLRERRQSLPRSWHALGPQSGAACASKLGWGPPTPGPNPSPWATQVPESLGGRLPVEPADLGYLPPSLWAATTAHVCEVLDGSSSPSFTLGSPGMCSSHGLHSSQICCSRGRAAPAGLTW